MVQQIVVTIGSGKLSIGATDSLDAATVNLWLDMAKRQILNTGVIDEVLKPPEPKPVAPPDATPPPSVGESPTTMAPLVTAPVTA